MATRTQTRRTSSGGQSRARTSGRAAETAAVADHSPKPDGHGLRVPVPHLSVTSTPVHVPHAGVPHLRVPGLAAIGSGSTPGRLLWLGGLAAVAALGVIDWPVAAVVAAGSYVAEQRARHIDRE